MKLAKKIKSLVNKLPYVRGLYKQSLNCMHPNGHYYSPVFSIEDVRKRQDAIWKNVDIDGIWPEFKN
ncbi:hypothetical protein [Flavobacterium sp. 3HN19-14]|uniref:hypothetical protein n=1 Tax=Flavobacterium sp. 3HN19-14 TaxID=3448133 RepID=UPI003EE0B007